MATTNTVIAELHKLHLEFDYEKVRVTKSNSKQK